MDREEAEIRSLVASGIADDNEHAYQILKAAEEQRRRANLYIFYADYRPVKVCLARHLIDEQPYGSNVRLAAVPAGVIGQIRKVSGLANPLAIGKLREFVPRSEKGKPIADQETRLVAFVRKFPIQEKSGIFLSPFSAKAVHARGKKTIDERENLLRIEFSPIGKNFVLGMFDAWEQQGFSERASLLLCIHRSQVTNFGSA